MASDAPRRRPSSSAAQSSTPSSSASPLPPAKAAAATTRSAFARFVQPLYGASRPSSLQNKTETQKPQHHGAPRFPNRPNPLASQNIVHDTKLEINSIDMNQEKTHVVLAGRHQLQTVYVNDKSCAPKLDFREALTRQENDNAGKLRVAVDLHNVKWSNGRFNTYVAGAATSNGRISLFDTARPGIEVARLHEHSQQVFSLAFNPHDGRYLLSGGSDGVIKLWNIDDTKREQRSLNSQRQFPKRARPTMDAITDIKWSPSDGFEFAIGTRAGVIERWDMRQDNKPLLRIPAHSTRCAAVDWHPDGKHVLSAGEDQWIRVWDFSVEKNDRKAKWELKCPYPIAHARWRPTCFSSGPQEGKGQWQSTQLVTAYERNRLPVVHIWDFRRQHIPFREISDFTSPPCSLLWHSQDLLWSATREGVFYQSDMKYAQKPLEWRPKVPFAVSPTGEIVAFHSAKTTPKQTPELFPKANEKRDLSLPSANRGSFDDSIDESFLVSSFSYKPHHSRRESNRSAKSASSTPPAASAVRNAVRQDDTIPFDIVMSRKDEAHAPAQKAFRGRVPGHINPLFFIYFAQKLQSDPSTTMTRMEAVLRLRSLLEKNAAYYERVGMHRAAQTWRTLSLLLWAELCDRANRAYRVKKIKETEEILALAEPYSEDKQGSFAADEEQGEVRNEALKANVEPGERHAVVFQIDEDGGDKKSSDLQHKPMSVKSPNRRLDMDNDLGHGGSTSEVSTPRAKPYGVRTHPVPQFTLPGMAVESLMNLPGQSAVAPEAQRVMGIESSGSTRGDLGSPNAGTILEQLSIGTGGLPRTSAPQLDRNTTSRSRPHAQMAGAGSESAQAVEYRHRSPSLSGARTGGEDTVGMLFKAGEIEERKAGLSNWRAQPRTLLQFDSLSLVAQAESTSYRPAGQYQSSLMSTATGVIPSHNDNSTRSIPLDRHNSDESFGMFPSTSDSGSQRIDLSEPGSLSSRQSDHSLGAHDLRPTTKEPPIALPGFQSSTSRLPPQPQEISSVQPTEGSVHDTLQSFTTDESTDRDDSPTRVHTHESEISAVATLPDIVGQTTSNSTDKTAVKPSQCSQSASASPSAFQSGSGEEATVPTQSKHPLLQSLTHAARHRKFSEEDLAVLTSQALQLLSKDTSDDEQTDFLAKLQISDFEPPSFPADRSRVLSMQDLLQHLQKYYTQCVADPQMLETITRFSDFALNDVSDDRSSDLETAVWLSYYEQLHKYAQHAVANHLAGVVHAKARAATASEDLQSDPVPTSVNGILSAKASAIEWPNSTISVNCSKCDKPANNGECSNCRQRLGLCSYCWQRTSPYPWPSRSKKSRELEILPSSSSDLPLTQAVQGGLWSFCTACNHGIHAGCREQRRKEPALEGKWDRCPVAACVCVCIVGREGAATVAKVEVPEVVLGGGERKVRESRAVKEVKFVLQ